MLRVCPQCGHFNVPKQRSGPEYVDGDLLELDPETLAAMRREIARIDEAPRVPQNLPRHAQIAIINRHNDRLGKQKALRVVIAGWAGYLHAAGRSDSEIYRTFYHTFGMDIASAQTLNAKDAEKLTGNILRATNQFKFTKHGDSLVNCVPEL